MAKASEAKSNVPVLNPDVASELAELGLDINQLKQDSGAGVSGMDAGDIALPYISILQPMSPQCNAASAAYIEGAQPGMLFNTVNNDLYDGRNQGILVISCAYERKYVEWIDRDKGGGWVGDHDIDSDILTFTELNKDGRPVLKVNGNFIVETAYHYSLFLNPLTEDWSQGVVALKSTFLRANRKWNNALVTTKIPGTDLVAPRWLYPYHMKTVSQQKGNNSWWVPEFERADTMVNKKLYDMSRHYCEMVNKGELTRAAEGSVDTGEEIPF